MKSLWELIDRFLLWVGSKLDDGSYQRMCNGLDRIYTILFLGAVGTMVIGGTITSIMINRGDALVAAILISAAMVPIGYFAYRFEDGCKNVGSADLLPLSVNIYLDLIMISNLFASIFVLIAGGLILFMRGPGGYLLLIACAQLITAWLVANPKRLGVRVDAQHGASRDLITLFMLNFRILVRAAVPLSRIGLVCGSIGVLVCSLLTILPTHPWDRRRIEEAVIFHMILVIVSVSLPIVSYFLYVIYSFFIGLVENILSIKRIAYALESTGKAGAFTHSSPLNASGDPLSRSKDHGTLPIKGEIEREGALRTPSQEHNERDLQLVNSPDMVIKSKAVERPEGSRECNIKWSDGSLRPGVAHQTHQGRVLISFPDGTEDWVSEAYVIFK